MRATLRIFWFLITFITVGCAMNDGRSDDENPDSEPGSDADADSDADTDADTDTDGDSDSDSDSDTDADSDTGEEDAGVIIPDCNDCSDVGDSLEEMRCAVELCDDEVFLGQEYKSPTNALTDETYAAIEHYGDSSNHLAPLMNDSYAVMATGTVLGTDHDVQLNPNDSMDDPFSSDGYGIQDVMEWRIDLKAPSNAGGIQIAYMFFSAEFDEYVGTAFNDKFYIMLETEGIINPERKVINFTQCRNPDIYFDFGCSEDLAETGACNEGEELCYVAINTALSECCWYEDCPNGTGKTDISGTGFSCAADQEDEMTNGQPDMDKGQHFGSTSGWMTTEWPIEPDETFRLIFHIHDTSDSRLDSAVIIDHVLFVEDPDPGTGPI